MEFHEEAFECTTEIVAAAMEEAEVELSAEGGEQVAEFFSAIYHRLAEIVNGKEEKPAKPGSFEVYQDKAGEYRFRLKAANGEAIADSEGYKTKASCMKGIESVLRSAPGAEVKEI